MDTPTHEAKRETTGPRIKWLIVQIEYDLQTNRGNLHIIAKHLDDQPKRR